MLFGEQENVEKLCEWLHKGPPAAKVIHVQIEEVAWEDHKEFVKLT